MTLEVDLKTDVAGFFRHMVENAAEQAKLEPSGYGVTYVAALLEGYVRLRRDDRRLLSEPLTFALHRAAAQRGALRVERLRAVGDTVLYSTGYFAEHLAARGVSLPYVRGLGARAYDLLAQSLTGGDSLFTDLAHHFDDYARLVELVSEHVAATSASSGPAGTLALYERWLKSRSLAASSALIERGLLPTKPPTALH